MPVRAFLIFLCLVVFLATTIARAEDCSCPVIECEPCQNKLFLGPEKKQCSMMQTVECPKFVCENNNNYFQCLSGTPPLYVPPHDPNLRYTEPHYTNPASQVTSSPVVKVRDIPSIDQAVLTEELGPPDEPVKVRGPASVEPTLPSSQPSTRASSRRWSLTATQTAGSFYNGHSEAERKSIFHGKTRFVARQKSKMNLQWGKDVVKVSFAKGAALTWGVQDDVLVAEKINGEISFDVLSKTHLFVADLGEWRFGKKGGTFKVSKNGAQTLLENTTAAGVLRREGLISPSQSLVAGQIIKLEEGVDIYSSVDSPHVEPVHLTLASPQGEAVQTRAPAADSFCNTPTGQYEQCAWKCFSPGADATACSSRQSAGAKCVRFTCSADGNWKLPTIVSEGECTVRDVHVGNCH